MPLDVAQSAVFPDIKTTASCRQHQRVCLFDKLVHYDTDKPYNIDLCNVIYLSNSDEEFMLNSCKQTGHSNKDFFSNFSLATLCCLLWINGLKKIKNNM